MNTSLVIFNASEFGAVIRQGRKSQGLTQSELALAAGVSLRFVSELERGKQSASLELAFRIAGLLNIRVSASLPA
ncbi:helix-turn-helix domain-containing protein [Emcibacter sp. SYSU 3D8]|uniref:helix-turn-helix transcriptional regulator n=1 Tax=Emcibacter sp. SYSU 3D8 TaxID=3133969 RepID=UPI0031FE7F1A